MTKIIKKWYQRNFSEPDAVRLVSIFIILLFIIYFLGGVLVPIFVSIVIAYLLDGVIDKFRRLHIPNYIAVSLVLLFSISFILITSIVLVPILWKQLANLVHDIPTIVSTSQEFVSDFIAKYPAYFSDEVLDNFFINIKDDISSSGQVAITYMLSSIPNIMGVVVYIVMVPLLVFFLLIDKEMLLTNIKNNFDGDSQIIAIGREINTKLGNFVRGKMIEIFIISVISMASFAILGLDYSILLGFLVGLSVLIPFIGAIIVTLPILIIALMQWGISSDFLWLSIIYSIILFFDANILVPILFAEAVKMNPLTILIAILLFGGLFGFWGVFFAIPLAVIIKAVLTMWPKAK